MPRAAMANTGRHKIESLVRELATLLREVQDICTAIRFRRGLGFSKAGKTPPSLREGLTEWTRLIRASASLGREPSLVAPGINHGAVRTDKLSTYISCV